MGAQGAIGARPGVGRGWRGDTGAADTPHPPCRSASLGQAGGGLQLLSNKIWKDPCPPRLCPVPCPAQRRGGGDDKGVRLRGGPRGKQPELGGGSVTRSSRASSRLYGGASGSTCAVSPPRMGPLPRPRPAAGATLRGPAGGRPVRGRFARLPRGGAGDWGCPGTSVLRGDTAASPGSPDGDRWTPSCLRERALRPGVGFGGAAWSPSSTTGGAVGEGRAVARHACHPRLGFRCSRGYPESPSSPAPGGMCHPSHPLPNRRGTTWGADPRHRRGPGRIRSPSPRPVAPPRAFLRHGHSGCRR